jgi:hypothetical protein
MNGIVAGVLSLSRRASSQDGAHKFLGTAPAAAGSDHVIRLWNADTWDAGGMASP